MWVIQKLEAYLSEKSATCLPAVETANFFLTLALFSQQTNMLLPAFWCVGHCATKERCLLGSVFCLGQFIHLHDRYFCSNPCVHVHAWTCLHKWASPVSGSLIQHPKGAFDSAPLLSRAPSRFCCKGTLYSLSFKLPQKWWVDFRRIL